MLQKSAESGSALAELALGDCYRDGIGVGKDCDEALNWYLKAAEAGNATAQRNLAGEPGKCPGLSDDTEKARWLKLSAEQGNVEACLCLASAYNSGKGVPQSLSDSYVWYSIAAALPGEYKGLSAFMRDQIGEKLSQSSLESSQVRSVRMFDGIFGRMKTKGAPPDKSSKK